MLSEQKLRESRSLEGGINLFWSGAVKRTTRLRFLRDSDKVTPAYCFSAQAIKMTFLDVLPTGYCSLPTCENPLCL